LSVVQALLSSHWSGVPAMQTPMLQVSAPLQTLPSEHDMPSLTLVCTQRNCVSGPQVSTVHGLPSSHVAGHVGGGGPQRVELRLAIAKFLVRSHTSGEPFQVTVNTSSCTPVRKLVGWPRSRGLGKNLLCRPTSISTVLLFGLL